MIIDTGSGSVTRVISFSGSISGLQALSLAGASPVTTVYGGQGYAVCKLLGVGNEPDSCLGTSSDPRYWAYLPRARRSGWMAVLRRRRERDDGQRRRRRRLELQRHRAAVPVVLQRGRMRSPTRARTAAPARPHPFRWWDRECTGGGGDGECSGRGAAHRRRGNHRPCRRGRVGCSGRRSDRDRAAHDLTGGLAPRHPAHRHPGPRRASGGRRRRRLGLARGRARGAGPGRGRSWGSRWCSAAGAARRVDPYDRRHRMHTALLLAADDPTRPLYFLTAFGAGVISFLSPCVLPDRPRVPEPHHRADRRRPPGGRHQGPSAHRGRHRAVRRRVHRGVRAPRAHHHRRGRRAVPEPGDAHAHLRGAGDPDGPVPRRIPDPDGAPDVPGVPVPPEPRPLRQGRDPDRGRRVRSGLDALHRAGARRGAHVRRAGPEPAAGRPAARRLLGRARAVRSSPWASPSASSRPR